MNAETLLELEQERLAAEDALASATAALGDSVKTARLALEAAEVAYGLALDGSPHTDEVRACRDRLGELGEAIKEARLDLAVDWPHPGKTTGTAFGTVTRATSMGVEVVDAEAAAKELLDRRLWAFVKELKVDAKGLRPLVDAGGVAGIAAVDKHSIRVKLDPITDEDRLAFTEARMDKERARAEEMVEP